MARGIELLSDEQMRTWMASVRWIFAASMPKHPHEYCLKREQDADRFERAVLTIHERGYDRWYLERPWRSLDVGEFYVWYHTLPEPGMEAPLSATILVNRARRTQERLL